ncbi:MAG: hypothetical protein A2365_03015 [Candidatus Nealsonbacteria bacterium RIFOXYB1_FULL_40_15]|uniref:Ferredoxin n=2 Tax=Candidatus Nealsoniibacteriota TaxID=1817911 RepID=A0A1G2ETQ3_9BACT|nr:MAG: hypothetical protein A2365_03015 [Candidatus Nealsonbacteria bacterium RIFOXYB1_FULL_40_15]OGZ29199.1 MAG: hypothetical protein A2427_02870 [Candidatus Nealsonbacteria bacterium RIFOXYC1_FULL_40_7]OGZ29880.1 MAG: hypothetical protein A2562_02050 [Candidatus Nealsonbacteria bacterium RIFOXYD1_FULL_39_11]
MKKINITINGKKIPTFEGKTILESAEENGIYIPALCSHSDLKVKANCRICCVEVLGELVPACSTNVSEGMKVSTDSEKVKRARKTNLELLFAQHAEECHDCVWNGACDLLKIAEENKVRINKFKDRKQKFPVYQFGQIIQFDSSKCIDCGNCIEVCKMQGVGFLEKKNNKSFNQVSPSSKWNVDCIYCGQCITHCPAGAFEAKGEFEEIEEPLKNKSKKIIFQFAPAVRSSIGEEFGMKEGSVVTGKIVSALKKLGADKVFDISVGADFTTVFEAKEVVERIKKNKNLPVLTSCCPAWVRYVELHYPKLIKNLSTARSPHIILGGLIKTYWAEKNKISPKDIIVISIMPCVAKKYEILKPRLKIKGFKPVDYVLTAREFSRLVKSKKIDFKNLKPKKADNVFGDPSGAGIIYGASGGVMESAFRTAYEKLSGKKLKDVNFIKARGLKGIKEAEIKIGKDIKKIAVVSGLGNVKEILNKALEYTCIEVMACPGGCIGGGGQPMPVNDRIRQKRSESLYSLDRHKKIRRAHENPIVKEILKENLSRKIFHTYHDKEFKNKNKII